MKDKQLTDEELSTIIELISRLWNKVDVWTRQELELLDKLQDIKERLK